MYSVCMYTHLGALYRCLADIRCSIFCIFVHIWSPVCRALCAELKQRHNVEIYRLKYECGVLIFTNTFLL